MDTLSSHVSPSEPARLRVLVQLRTWDWLFALRRAFTIDVQLVDDQLAPTLRDTGGVLSDLTSLLVQKPPVLAQAIETAARTGVPQGADLGEMHCVCFALDRAKGASGVLVVGRHARLARGREDKSHGELEILARWLAAAVEAHLLSAPAGEPDALHRASSLHRILGALANNGKDRDLVARFADAMAIWHDLEITGYVEGDEGTFVREVFLPGADLDRTPASLSPSLLPEDLVPLRLFRADGARLGFTAVDEGWLVRLPGGDEDRSWLLTVSGPVARDEQVRLHLYFLLLNGSLVHASARSHARVMSAIAHQLPSDEAPDVVAGQVVDALRRELMALSVSLSVQAATGLTVLHALSRDPAAGPAAAGAVSSITRITAGMTLDVSVGLGPGRQVSPQEHKLITAAADVLEEWLARLAPRLATKGERRGVSRSYDQIIERFAAQALNTGSPVCVLILSTAHEPYSRDLRQQSVRVRTALRGTDLVGVLGEGQIAVLLQDASRDRGRMVAHRLTGMLSAVEGAGDPQSPWTIGLATREPGDPATGLVQQARGELDGRGHVA